SLGQPGPAQRVGQHGPALVAGEIYFEDVADRQMRPQLDQAPYACPRFLDAPEIYLGGDKHDPGRAEPRVGLRRPARRQRCVFETAGEEVRVGESVVRKVNQRIEWAE